jgi:GDPmannose 4,6-dehydratase
VGGGNEVTVSLITGITGQDGSYLAEQLTQRGDQVYGLVRGQWDPRWDQLMKLMPQLTLLEGDLLDQLSIQRALTNVYPDEIYNLAGISAPATGWSQPVLTAEVTGLGLLRLLEAVHSMCPYSRVLQASSLALHGPYGAAKMFADSIADDYRKRGLHVSSIIMGGHHSPRRPPNFFSRKVTRAVAEIATGRRERLTLGPLGRRQDWGWANDFTVAMQEVIAIDPGRYVVSTGQPYSCEEWVATAFDVVKLNWRDYVDHDKSFVQPTDVDVLSAQPSIELKWQPRQDFHELVRQMVNADVEVMTRD